MKNNRLFIGAVLLLLILGYTSCSQRPCLHEKFVGNAEMLLDSTLKYYKAETACLFNETYPKNSNERITYLADGSDTVRGDKVAYLWPTSGLFSAVNALLSATGNQRYGEMLEEMILPGLQCYYDTVRVPPCYQSYIVNAGCSDRYYDDNIWLGIDFLESYELTGKQAYLDKAEQIWEFLESGRDSVLGGGIYWCEQKKKSKNTCSNAPASVLALKLYRATRNEIYLKAGKDLYHWTKNILQDTDDNLYYDNIKLDGTIDKAKYAYNSGQMLQAAALLYQLTGEPQYTDAVEKLSKACDDYFFEEPDERFPFRRIRNGNVWFVSIMLRGFEEAYAVNKDPQYLENFIATLDYMWEHNANGNRLFEDNCFVECRLENGKHKWLLTQAAIIEMYARLSSLKIK